MIRRLAHRASDFIERKGVWIGAGWGIATMLLIDGVSYTILGNKVAQGPSFSLLAQYPGGMHIVGVVMTALSLALFKTVKHRDRTSQLVLFASFVLGNILVCYTIGGWINAHQAGVSASSKWFLLSWLSLWLSVTTFRRAESDPHDKRS